ncbi:hypothetical protein GCM10025868_39350 [Angustibacter aerolatus]|uniref:Glycosyl hydrolase family 13 catalytic domain-containing protein n=1 Tax=Angustibacter aerolatus TaxID=1162965 RepID=A0ABQ6JN57_9ACTN|nr:alpha-amylase family glycosyl hydrolase [Angustibacter aerolatus]GMA88685.1 hypothetical protein GCM10025868_39350 [Angustibacter aerolatus]
MQRPLALTGAWYEFFPRSEGAVVDPVTGEARTGTLRTAAERLDGIAAMGFDVAYLTPIHPIGTSNRKGRNNTLHTEPGDPGSPYAIGSPDGGHDAIDPSLGTFEDFDAFVARAREVGLEVALDLALQCSPDHPWVSAHPEWFTTRADGSIAYAENPPKKYQDIYPLNFDNDPDGISREVLRVVLTWVQHGVTLFRVDNPHTKPVRFWEWLIAQVNERHPEVIFLAEAFTKPAMMHTLGKVGFHQSYTYFAWRNDKEGLTEYLTEPVGPGGRLHAPPSGRPRTTSSRRTCSTAGGPRSSLRAVLAATMSPTYGIYAGYEPGRERGPAGRRGAGRQREVRVQAARLGGRGGRGHQPGAAAHPAEPGAARAPGPAAAAQHPLPRDRQRPGDRLQQAAHRGAVTDRSRRHGDRRGEPRPARRAGDDGAPRHAGAGHGLAGRLRRARPAERPDLALG